MTNNQPSRKKNVLPKSKKVATFALITLAILFTYFAISTIAIPLLQNNGVNSFTGAKKKAAQEVYDLVYTSGLDNKNRMGYKVSIEEVYPTPAGTCPADSVWTKNVTPDNPRYYTVKVSIRQLFTYAPAETEVHTPCNKYW